MKRHQSGDLFERILGGPVLWAGLAIMTLFAMGPFLWALSASLKTRVELYVTPITYIPLQPTLRNYVEAWTSRLTPFSVFFANSLWVSSVTMVATIVISTSAGYALARFRFIGKNTLMLVFLATQMFPAVLLIPPLLSQWYALGLIDTYQALIYSNFSFTVPFTVWMLVGYFESIPRELEESAMIDGSSRFGAMLKIIVPLAAPGIAATAIFAYNGYGAAVYFSEETRNAAKGIARAIMWSLAITVAAELIPMTAVILGAPDLGDRFLPEIAPRTFARAPHSLWFT